MTPKLFVAAFGVMVAIMPVRSLANREMRPRNAEEGKTIVVRYLNIFSRAHVLMFQTYEGNKGISSARLGWDYVRDGVEHVCTGNYDFDTEQGAEESDLTY